MGHISALYTQVNQDLRPIENWPTSLVAMPIMEFMTQERFMQMGVTKGRAIKMTNSLSKFINVICDKEERNWVDFVKYLHLVPGIGKSGLSIIIDALNSAQ